MLQLSTFEIYLLYVNIAGFILFLINTLLYRFTEEKSIDLIITIASIIGGYLGIFIAFLIFDRSFKKENMMSRVFMICMLVIQTIIFLIYKGMIADDLTFTFWTLFSNYKILIWYLVIINFVAIVAYAVDKIAAIERKSRIRISTLLGIAFAGGSLGALIGMYLFHHKTKIDYFVIGVPLIIIMQIIVLFYAMNIA